MFCTAFQVSTPPDPTDSLTVLDRFGGEAVSLAINYAQSPLFRAAAYQPFLFNGAQYGRVREYGNLSFAVLSDAGHLVPADQPEVSLELFRRALAGLDLASGRSPVSDQTELPFTPDPPLSTTSHGVRPSSSPSFLPAAS